MARLRLKTSAMTLAPEETDLGGLSELVGGDNPSGSLIWRALMTGADRAELVAMLLHSIDDLDPERAADDVDALLEALRELDLIEEESA